MAEWTIASVLKFEIHVSICLLKCQFVRSFHEF